MLLCRYDPTGSHMSVRDEARASSVFLNQKHRLDLRLMGGDYDTLQPRFVPFENREWTRIRQRR